tara:strand:+ start:110 stop:409 length:300 start_codon:yes stop_codon:yes gene_type:complete
MTFSEYVELLYKAYLLDRGVLTKLRDKMKDGSYLQDLEDDPEMQNWNQINPRSIDPRKQGRSKYYPNRLNPQEGVRVFESREKKAVKKVMGLIKRRDRK